jgi:hypothetical protein
MIHRNRRGTRAKVAVAAAVLVGGGAAGVVAIAANHGAAAASAQSAAFATRYRQTISEPTALMGALNGWNRSPNNAMTMLAEMKPMRTFSQVGFHRTELAAQRGVVVLATKKFLLVKSRNGSLHLWWLSGGTKFENVTANATGMTAMTGSPSAAASVMTTGSMNSAASAMAGSMSAVNAMTTPAAKPTTLTVSTGNEVITITISWASATVTQPRASASATPSATVSAAASTSPTASASATPTATTTQPVTMTTQGVARGDLVFVVGERVHGKLIAKLVLFAAPKTAVTPTPSASVSASVSATATVKPTGTSTAVPTVAPTPTSTAPTFTGAGS